MSENVVKKAERLILLQNCAKVIEREKLKKDL
jgi:hypothetical protein